MKFAPLVALVLLAPAARAGDLASHAARGDAVFEALVGLAIVVGVGVAACLVLGYTSPQGCCRGAPAPRERPRPSSV